MPTPAPCRTHRVSSHHVDQLGQLPLTLTLTLPLAHHVDRLANHRTHLVRVTGRLRDRARVKVRVEVRARVRVRVMVRARVRVR